MIDCDERPGRLLTALCVEIDDHVAHPAEAGAGARS
jgi:hypothetical protein